MSPGERVMARAAALAEISEEPGGLTRRYLTPEHRKAADTVLGWMEQAGMAAGTDALGTVAGRYEGAAPGAPALLLGSHIDTVRQAGAYDGNLGVIAAIECVAALSARNRRLPFAIEVLAFGDEEGSRFTAVKSGSMALAGRFDPAGLAAVDADGVRLADALRAFGGDPAGAAGLARPAGTVLAYVELHIEQGPVLEAEGLPVGVVTAINGASRFAVEVTGIAGHAGTVPMGLRRDALAGAAEMVLAVEALAADGTDAVATVGQIAARPGSVNVVPGGARFTLDVRAPEDRARHAVAGAIREAFEDIAGRRRLALDMRCTYDVPATACDPDLVAQLEEAVGRAGVRPYRLPSGAGHDAQSFDGFCPVAMLFVRCSGGVSHNPAESITMEDADVATRVLFDFIEHFEPDA